MYKHISFTASVLIFCCYFSVQAVESPDGFVIWTEGTQCNGELKYQKLGKGIGLVEERKTAVIKGVGSDIMPVISFDGKWVSFARFTSIPADRYGDPCDYHMFDALDVFIARIDGALPATPIKIAHGYWPSWGDDSKQATKTLYFSKFDDGTIQKTTVQPDGSFSPPVQHAACLKIMRNSSAHTQGSPDGKYIAYRPAGMQIQDVAANKNISGSSEMGCHPCWGPRSKYLIWAKNNVCIVKDGTKKRLGSAGFGDLYYGISNDAEYDQGKLWAVGCITGSGSNAYRRIIFKSIDISNDGWKPDSTSIRVSSNGTWCDIHVYPPVKTQQNSKPHLTNRVTCTAKVLTNVNGMQLVIESQGLSGYRAQLYDLLGKRRSVVELTDAPRISMP